MHTLLMLAALAGVAGWWYWEVRRSVERMVDRLVFGDPAGWERIWRVLEARGPHPTGPALGARINGHRQAGIDWVTRRAA